MTERPLRIIGYARVSTRGQDLSYQLAKLQAAGCSKIYREKRSAKNYSERSQLKRLLRSLRVGDLVLATATDRVARDPVDLLNILQTVRKAGAGLRLLDEPFIDTTSEMADLVLFLVGWAARWQRRRILENTAHGRVLARERGVQFGRPRKLTDEQRSEIRRTHRDGKSVQDLAREYAVSTSTIARVLG
ncbi:Site-specific DNA recombinase [Ensifer adhaerens]|nr:Site-specific DNA recombinase [Ensifer adhaerens]